MFEEVTCLEQGQRHDTHGGPCLDKAEDFQMTADAVIAACRGVVCWGGTALIPLGTHT